MTNGITELENYLKGIMFKDECIWSSNEPIWWTIGNHKIYTDRNKIYNIVSETVKPVEEHKEKEHKEKEHKEKEITKPVKNFKSNKKRKADDKNIISITDKNINIFIEKYLNNHPEIIENYLKENLKIDFKKATTNTGDTRWALALFFKDKAFSSSTLGLNIY